MSNMPQCIIGSIPKRIKVGIAKPCNSGTETNGEVTVITADAVGTRSIEPVTNTTTNGHLIVPTSFLCSR